MSDFVYIPLTAEDQATRIANLAQRRVKGREKKTRHEALRASAEGHLALSEDCANSRGIFSPSTPGMSRHEWAIAGEVATDILNGGPWRDFALGEMR